MADPYRVCIVEDDDLVRDGLKQMVQTSSIFECVGDFSKAEDLILEMMELKPHLVLMDINLPGMSGIEAIKLVRRSGLVCHVMMLTVFDHTDTIFQALQAGATGYLLKKSTPQKVLEAMQDIMNGGSPMSGEIARKVVLSFQQPATSVKEEYNLSSREQEILDLLIKGFLYKEIAAKLFISLDTVRSHIRNIYRKLEVQSRSQAFLKSGRSL